MDKQYLQKVLAGDTNSFRYFVQKYQDMAFSIAKSIVKSDLLAEEAVQDAFVKAYQNIRKYKQKAKFSTWLYRIVVNESLRKVQKRRIDLDKTDDLSDLHDRGATGDSFKALHEVEQKEIVQSTLAKMPIAESLLMRLYYLEDNSIEEIVEITRLSKSNVKVSLHRGRKRFYHILESSYKHEIKSLL